MQTIVSNTSPLRYLTYIGEQAVLPALFGKILIPQKVFEELTRESTPTVVRIFFEHQPSWIEIRDVQKQPDREIEDLDPGEQQAILLAEQVQSSLLLIDDMEGRVIAEDRGIVSVGTIGIIDRADMYKKINLPSAIDKLLRTNFRIKPRLVKQILERHYQRNQNEINS